MAHHSVISGDGAPAIAVSRPFAWAVFALTFGLLISDYMSRQVLNAVFPVLKAEWRLTDSSLGALGGAVALMVGLLTFPLSLLADAWGRVKSIALMAVLWSLATLACGLARSYDQMLGARFLVGIGEAAYGSVGIAVVLSVFPASLRATLTAAFMAGGMFGSVFGMGLGGALAGAVGWRWSFVAMALFGLALAIIYPLVVRPRRLDVPARLGRVQAGPVRRRGPAPLMSLVSAPSVVAAYVGSGLQLFVSAAVLAWIPSYLNRYYALKPDRASIAAAAFVLVSGVGMIACGMLSDRLGRGAPERKIVLACIYCLLTAMLLGVGFRVPAGPLQLALIAAGMFVSAGVTGPSGAMVANLTHPAVQGAAFATLTLSNNLLGLAPGPFITGALADRTSLLGALQIIPFMSLPALAVFLFACSRYLGDLEGVEAMRAPTQLAEAGI
ncbi:MAG TPA: MFS transporter [Caulobacteraceae bacterium]